MVLYTPAARAQIGGAPAMVAELTGAVNNANLALANAGAVHRYRLVHQAEIAYTETGDVTTSLNRLTSGVDGYLDSAFALRNQYRADDVTLLTTDSDACGIGWLMGAGQRECFVRVSRLQRRLVELREREPLARPRDRPQHGPAPRPGECGQRCPHFRMRTGTPFPVWPAM